MPVLDSVDKATRYNDTSRRQRLTALAEGRETRSSIKGERPVPVQPLYMSQEKGRSTPRQTPTRENKDIRRLERRQREHLVDDTRQAKRFRENAPEVRILH